VALAALVNGVSREVVLDPDWSVWRELAELQPLHPEVAAVIRGSFRRNAPPQIRGSGYVVKSLEAALWAFAGAESFREAVLRAVNLGDDADTTGAVCGQLSGAHWGESGIPEELLSGLAGRELLERALQGLLG
jgi:ADP-ribosylglycohydrolase